MEAKNDELIRLPSTRLIVRANELIKENWENQVVARHLLSDIEDVSIRRATSYSTIVVFLSSLLGAVIGKMVIQSTLWSWVTTIVLGLTALIVWFSIKRAFLDVKTSSGTVSYELSDGADLVDGFEVSLSAILKKQRET